MDKPKKELKPNKFKIEFIDNTHLDAYNESCTLEKKFYGCAGDEEGTVLDLETYFYMCREFALAMGYAESTVNEWFEC